MTNYILIILSVGISAFILECVLSSFDSYKSISPAVKFIYSLCVFCAIIFPVLSIKPHSLNVQKNNEVSSNSQEKDLPSFNLLLKNELENKISSEIFNQFGILCDSVSIDLISSKTSGQTSISITNAHIVLSNEHCENITQIEACLKNIPELNGAKITCTTAGNQEYD